jgi:hypothetical protein
MDFIIQDAAECEGLLGGQEHLCEAIEDYCVHENITHVPKLYRYIFDARGGFLTQSKAIYYLQEYWIEEAHYKNDNILILINHTKDQVFLEFLKNNSEKFADACHFFMPS